MDIAELVNSCGEKGWKTETLSDHTVRVVFLSGESVTVSFLVKNARCKLMIPAPWVNELKKQYSFTLTTGGDILWDCSALPGFLDFAERMDQAVYEKLPISGRKRPAYQTRRRREKDWSDYKLKLLSLTSTERTAEITGRVGQSQLRELLLSRFGACVITGISEPELLVASHIKPWGECDNIPTERLNENNVLLLSAALDKLFDAHYISFDCKDGKMLVSPLITEETLNKLGVFSEKMQLTILNDEQARFLQYHNEHLRS